MQQNEIAGVLNKAYGFVPDVDETFFCIKNTFYRQIVGLMDSLASQNKLLQVITKSGMSRRGAVNDRDIKAEDKSVIDLMRLSGICGLGQTVCDEMARFNHAAKWGILGDAFDSMKEHRTTMSYDYMLSSSLCYVEEYGKNELKVNKYFATSNLNIVKMLCPQIMDPNSRNNINKLSEYLVNPYENYNSDKLRIIKITFGKETKMVKPNTPLDLNGDVKVTPFPLLVGVLRFLSVNKSKIYRFTFVKDNGTERVLETTLNTDIITNAYGEEVGDLYSKLDTKTLNRGYLRMIELGLPCSSDSLTRALNVSRITSVEEIPDFDRFFLDLDLRNVVNDFNSILYNHRGDARYLDTVYTGLTHKTFPNEFKNEDKVDAIQRWVSFSNSIGTTSFQKSLCRFMIENSMMFDGYDGKPRRTTGGIFGGSGFNLGVQ